MINLEITPNNGSVMGVFAVDDGCFDYAEYCDDWFAKVHGRPPTQADMKPGQVLSDKYRKLEEKK